jgi:hypothetical protein
MKSYKNPLSRYALKRKIKKKRKNKKVKTKKEK